MTPQVRRLFDFLAGFYDEQEMSVLKSQIVSWSEKAEPPLRGKHVLDGTPVFRNTMLKYCALLAAEAEVTASVGDGVPCDEEILKILPDFGIRVADEAALTETYDAISDCGGRHRQVRSRTGYVELTRSGLEHYRRCSQPVIDVDSCVFKDFETTYGTGDGFVRAMRRIGHGDFAGRQLLVFGGGKVGRGIAGRALRAGASVAVADFKRPDLLDERIEFIPADDAEKVQAAIGKAWCVVSATGIAGALAKWADALAASSALIANMGLEDEYSPSLPSERVLNGKAPLNFILEEPTMLRFIAPAMAMCNASVCFLISGRELPPGLQEPPQEVSMEMLLNLAETGIVLNRD